MSLFSTIHYRLYKAFIRFLAGGIACACLTSTITQAQQYIPSRAGVHPSPPTDKAYNIYLTNNRICKDCTWRLISQDAVELTNDHGVSGIYPRAEIIGIDRHPILRRFVRSMAHGSGLAGRVVQPDAYDDEAHVTIPMPLMEQPYYPGDD